MSRRVGLRVRWVVASPLVVVLNVVLIGYRVSDAEHQVRTLDVCRDGERGRWTMLGDPFSVDYYWHVSSLIRHIEHLAPARHDAVTSADSIVPLGRTVI